MEAFLGTSWLWGPITQLLAFIAGEFLRPVTQEQRQTEDTKCTKDKHSISHSRRNAVLKSSLCAVVCSTSSVVSSRQVNNFQCYVCTSTSTSVKMGHVSAFTISQTQQSTFLTATETAKRVVWSCCRQSAPPCTTANIRYIWDKYHAPEVEIIAGGV